MNVEFFVHGVPNGEGFWGEEEDRNYFGTFYDHSSDEVKFLIQTRALKGKPYCYYNYLVYKSVGAQSPNVVAYDGRDGSYFGISLRLDTYCKDFANMYRLLDTVYNVYFMGKFLKMEKSKLKYTIPDFASESNKLESIRDETFKLLQDAFRQSESFVSLAGFPINGGNCPSINLYDCTPETVMATVKQHGRIVLSPYYPTSKEAVIQQQCNVQVQAIQQQYEARLKADADARAKEKNEISNSLSAAKSQVSQLQREIGQKDVTIGQLNSDVLRLQSEIRGMGQNRKVAQIIAPIREPIIELARVFSRMAPESPDRRLSGMGKKTEDTNMKEKEFDFSVLKNIKTFVPLLNFLLLIIVIIVLLNPFKNEPEDNAGSKAQLLEKIEQLENENLYLQKQLDSANDDINNRQNLFSTPSTFNMDLVSIDIKGYFGGDLKLNNTYDVEAKKGDPNGSWDGVGCIITHTDDNNKIKIKPTDGYIEIIYCVGEKRKSRTLTAK